MSANHGRVALQVRYRQRRIIVTGHAILTAKVSTWRSWNLFERDNSRPSSLNVSGALEPNSSEVVYLIPLPEISGHLLILLFSSQAPIPSQPLTTVKYVGVFVDRW